MVSKCQNSYCQLCEEYDLSRCITCWGRFGDPDLGNSCFEGRTCNTLSADTSFKDGCFRTSHDCYECEICDIGYAEYVKFSHKYCKDCRSLDQKCQSCSSVVGPDQFKCDLCDEGYGVSPDGQSC